MNAFHPFRSFDSPPHAGRPGTGQKPRARLWLRGATLLALLTGTLPAQVPQLINYQGRVAVAGVNFQGTGQFKFALVNGSGTAYWRNSVDTAPADGVPDAAVSLTVTKGLYSVLLGDATVTNMAVVPATVFNNADVRLRVWFNDGPHGWQLLTPDQRIGAVGYAIMSGNVPDGAITAAKIASGAVGSSQLATGAVGAAQLAAGAVGSAQLAAGAVGSTQLATGAVGSAQLSTGAAASNLNASGQSGVASGGTILAAETSSASLAQAGFVKLGRVDLGDVWEQKAGGYAASIRCGHTAVWTGSEMIVWGGFDDDWISFFTPDRGMRYNPTANSWTAVTDTGAPSERYDHTAVWTGSEMIIWGGIGSDTFNNGGRYNPATNRWLTMTLAGAPVARNVHTAVWTGLEMIVWGGWNGSSLNSGGRYSPIADSWTATTTTGAPVIRFDHSAVWTGSEMIVWGGYNGSYLNSGGRYNPTANSWVAMTTTGSPTVRADHSTVWSGSEMIVWGGFNGSYLNTGARYSPATNQWTATTATGAPSIRAGHSAVWTGSEMIVWAGWDGVSITDVYGGLNDGSRYNPLTNVWTATATTGAPEVRRDHTAVWTGIEMIIFGGAAELWDGGFIETDCLAEGARYNPLSNSWVPAGAANAPSPRWANTAVWTGSEMIIWGGVGELGALNTGDRYNLAANTWTKTTTTGAPPERFGHSAVWTGSEMIVWGGWAGDFFDSFNDGGRYSPVNNHWSALPTSGAPSARTQHTAVWTGSEMIVWGGTDNDFTEGLNTGGRYNPTSNGWTAVSTAGAAHPRFAHTAVWTGTEMIVWGGEDFGPVHLNDGGRYDPSSNSWTAVTTIAAPVERRSHTAVWTGSEMIVWGGEGEEYYELNDGGRYSPLNNNWLALSTQGAPVPRYHTAVWTGSEMIVCGFALSANLSSFSGERYNPSTNSWTKLTPVGAPPERSGHSAVWAGNAMIIYGGYNSQDLNDTFLYTPSQNLYLYQRP